MENLRRHYRHTFPTPERLQVEIDSPARRRKLVGSVVNLSVDGMRVQFAEAGSLATGERLTASWELPGVQPRLAVHASVVYIEVRGGVSCYGLQFLSSLGLNKVDTRHNLIWRYLLAEQRRLLRTREGAALPTSA